MSPRSSWKMAYVSNKVADRLANNQLMLDTFDQAKQTQEFSFTSTPLMVLPAERVTTITADMLGTKVLVHNGKVFRVLKVRKDHLGLRCGEFAYTRTLVKHKIVVAKKAPTKK